MDGGVLSVPFDRLNEFYEKYVEAIQTGEKLFLVEQKTPTYNFFVDLDYKDDTSLEIDEIKDICKVICDKVKRHGGKDCLISVSPPKKCGFLIKTGVHLNWSGFVVDQVSAIALRDHILIALSKAKPSIDWNEIVDGAVYGDAQRGTKGSGFRMIWSHKLSKGETQLAYLPIFIYKHGPLSGILKIDQKPDLEILKMSAVRTDAPQTHVVQSPSNVIKEGTFTKDQTKDEIHDNEMKVMVEEFIQKYLEGQGNASVTKIFKHKQLYLISTNSKYCENLRRNHGSNHVWFIVSGRYILQKCFCRCETIMGRKDGFCKDFCGRKHELSPKLIQFFYPEKTEILKCKEIKKFIEKPIFKHGDVAPDIQNFIQKYLKNQGSTLVSKVQKHNNMFSVLTTSNFCEKINGSHGDDVVMTYIIKNRKELSQKCPICKSTKNDRRYELTANVVSKLFPKDT